MISSKNDIKKLKTAASDLLRKIKTKISELDHWTDKQETRAVVDTLIRDVLWETLPAKCDNNDDITEYREKVYEYVFTRYKEIGIKAGRAAIRCGTPSLSISPARRG